jgi:hypothetical protein
MNDGKIGLAHLNGMRRDSLRDEIRASVSLAQKDVEASPHAEEVDVEFLSAVPDHSQTDKRWYDECIQGSRIGAETVEGKDSSATNLETAILPTPVPESSRFDSQAGKR